MDKVGIFIDGGYLQKILQKDFNSSAIDFSKFIHMLADKDPILRAYYYNCMPYKSNPPTQEEAERFAKMQKFVDSLEMIDRFQVRLGKLEYRGTSNNGQRIFQQKRVDILLGCDLVLLSAKQKIGKAIIVTGDSDFIPAIEIAKNEGVEIELVFSPQTLPHTSLIKIADVRHKLSQEEIDSIKFVK